MSRLALTNNKTKTMETIQKVKVHNMTSPSSNREVPNQFEIKTDEGIYFQSYNTVIAYIPYQTDGGFKSVAYLDAKMWDYSTTTGKYRNQFLGCDKAETMRRIKDGRYILTDLNA